ncbi:MAG: radical SAM protein [Muribaculaceae bacterium]|nr:radical SAM protein [Muribaculaceae bacterium]
MTSNIFQSEVTNMKSLNNLFIELTAKNCNQRCKHCYINFEKYKKVSDFINIDSIKQALNDTMHDDIQCIYLTGAEPMTHPDFNAILRLCLKRSNVCICTNGSFINEKKARFLKKVEDESTNEIIFKISLDHFDEIKNDDTRYRGAYRHGLFALKHLIKYEFNPIVSVTNYYNLPKEELIGGFLSVFERNNLDLSPANLQITPWHNTNSEWVSVENTTDCHTDCQTGRILTINGIYTCPFLANDYRGRCGSSFADFNKKSSFETSFCNTCLQSDKKVFSIDFSQFEG